MGLERGITGIGLGCGHNVRAYSSNRYENFICINYTNDSLVLERVARDSCQILQFINIAG